MSCCKGGQCVVRDIRKLKTSHGEEVDCECICKCKSTNVCQNCVCDCKCTPEIAQKTADGKYFCECTCTCSPDHLAPCCTRKESRRTIVKPCKLVTQEGDEVDCECICNCESSSNSPDCECNCACTPETARKGPDGKYSCQCDCSC